MKVESMLLDHLLESGKGADLLSRISSMRPDLCIRLRWGRLEAGYHDEEPVVLTGTMGVELTSEQWGAFALLTAELPQRSESYPK